MRHYTNLQEITNTYDYVYLSPHLDDAVLSCGGAIAVHSAIGSSVLVVTLCTAVPTREQLGPLAEEFHGDWNLAHEDAVTVRLREDLLAMERIGADCLWVGMLDSIYRLPFAYDTRERLFGTPRADDPLYQELRSFLAALREQFPRAIFYAPLAVGYHVDHQITYTVASESAGSLLAFYEDIYYVLIAGELERRLADLAEQFVPQTIDISAALARKIGAIDAYASQVPELFGGSESMARQITVFAEQRRAETGLYGERIWMHTVDDSVG
ncbi:MAG: PIG-L family deacetylase [Roseiflexaceae bacterium]|nr:PIG-L family deacetylase [Roseiflexaceae bacterium]